MHQQVSASMKHTSLKRFDKKFITFKLSLPQIAKSRTDWLFSVLAYQSSADPSQQASFRRTLYRFHDAVICNSVHSSWSVAFELTPAWMRILITFKSWKLKCVDELAIARCKSSDQSLRDHLCWWTFVLNLISMFVALTQPYSTAQVRALLPQESSASIMLVSVPLMVSDFKQVSSEP